MEGLQEQWEKLSVQQHAAFSSGVAGLDSLLTQLQELQEHVVNGTAPPSGLGSLVTRVNASAAECKTKLTKDFKNLHTGCTKLAAKLDKSFGVDLDEFCQAELYQSPAYLAATATASDAAAHSSNSANAVLPFASITPVNPAVAPANINAAAANAGSSSASTNVESSSTAAAEYSRAMQLLMEETWLREGRIDLVNTLRAECGQTAWAAAAGASANSSAISNGGTDAQNDASSVAAGFDALHSMVRALQRRDMEPCMQWLLHRKAALTKQMLQTEAELEQTQAAAATMPAHSDTPSASATAAAPALEAPASPAALRRHRVSFSAESGGGSPNSPSMEGVDRVAAASSAAISAHLSSLSTHLAGLRSAHAALHSLQFDLHRVRFLSILMESEQQMRTQAQQQRQRASRKRKSASAQHTGDDETDALSDSHASSWSPRLPRRPAPSVEADVSMCEAQQHESAEEAAALAADHSSSEREDDDREDEQDAASDEELNRIARSGGRPAAAQRPADGGSSSAPHQTALRYAQTFFPLFADTRMEDIRRLSGCLLFLGDLTSPSVSTPALAHPYASLFSPAGNAQLWREVIQQAKRLAFTHMQRAHTNPLSVSVQACDVALPQLLKYQSVLKLNHDMLAVARGVHANPELDLGPSFQYHSTFVCPVTKEQCSSTLDSDVGAPVLDLAAPLAPPAASPSAAAAAGSNPPVLLRCGHCISRHAMDKIVRNLRLARRFKCPTCPQEQSHADALIMHL